MHFHVGQGGRKGVCDLWDRSQERGNLFGTKINTGKLQPTSGFRRNMVHSFFVTFAMTTAPYFLSSAIRASQYKSLNVPFSQDFFHICWRLYDVNDTYKTY